MAEPTLAQKRALARLRLKQRQAQQALTATPSQAPLPSVAAPAAPGPPTMIRRRPSIDPAAVEAILAAATGAVAAPVSGFAGLAGLLPRGLVPPRRETSLERAGRFQAATQEGLTFEPRTEAGAAALETLGRGTELLEQGARLPVAGLAGIAQLPFGGIEGATETIRRITEEGVGRTAGAGLERIGAPPSISTFAEILPQALAAGVGVRNPFARVAPPRAPTTIRPTVTPTAAPPVSIGRPRLDQPVDFTPRQITPFEDPALARQAAAGAAEAAAPPRQLTRSRLDPEKFLDQFGNEVRATAAEIRRIDAPDVAAEQRAAQGVLIEDAAFTGEQVRTLNRRQERLFELEDEFDTAVQERPLGREGELDDVNIERLRNEISDLEELIDVTSLPAFQEPTVARQMIAAREPTATIAAPQPAIPAPRLEPSRAPTQGAVPVLSAEEIGLAARKGKRGAKVLAREVLPDPAILESAQRLGIDLNPEHYSTNVAFQSVARSLKARGEGELLSTEVRALGELSDAADDLTRDLGGSIDKAALSDDLVRNTRTTIDDLQQQADKAYAQVRATIPKQTRVSTARLKEHIEQQLADLGNDKTLLAPAEKKLLNVVNRAGEEGITYEALDRIRRDIGSGLNKNRGPFADNDTRVLGEIYDVLSDTQNGAAESFGIGPLYAEARNLIVQRKGLEAQAVSAFGKKLTGTIIQQLKTAAAGLAKADVAPLNKLLESLPEARRGELAATVLSELFSVGTRRAGELTTGFGNTWEALNRSPTAKAALMRHLPEGAPQRFDDIGRVMAGIMRANRKPLANPSGTGAALANVIKDGNLVEQLYGNVGSKIATEAAGVALGIPPGVTTFIGSLSSKFIPDRITKTDTWMASPEFARVIQEGLDGNIATANRIAEGSPRFKVWRDSLTPSAQRRLAATGFIGFLTGQGEQPPSGARQAPPQQPLPAAPAAGPQGVAQPTLAPRI